MDNKDNKKIAAVWGTAMLTAGPPEIPSNPPLRNNTCRQQIRVSKGGKNLRLVLSNEYGGSELVIESIYVSRLKSPESFEILTDSQCRLTFDSSGSIVIPAGKKAVTDTLDFEFGALEDLAITMKLGDVPEVITSHTASRCKAWVAAGDHSSDNGFSEYCEMTSWYFINELDVMTDCETSAVVCIGDSITDGASIQVNSFARYSDRLMELINMTPELSHISVIAKGIGGNAVFGGLGTAFKDRFDRDVLEVPGAGYCVMMIGINDIGFENDDMSGAIIEQYRTFIRKCNDKGIKIFGCTVTPVKGNGYYSELHEKTRLLLNQFIMSEDSGFDGYIDLASAVASKDDPAMLDKDFVSTMWKDNLHLNEAGYRRLGETVFASLHEYIIKEK